MHTTRNSRLLQIVLGLTLLGGLPTHVLAQDPNASETVPGELLVQFKGGVSPAHRAAIVSQVGAEVLGEIPQINVLHIRVPAAAGPATLHALQHNPHVKQVEYNQKVSLSLIPNDPLYATNEWHLPKIGASTAWDTTTGSTSIVIAILDSGVDGTHPDLAGKLVPGWNLYDNNSDTHDVNGHGTAVAGVAGASTNNGMGVASVAWNCKIMPIRISDLTGYALWSTLASGLTWAADHGAKVANASYAATDSSTVASAAQYFQNHGGVVAVSAGNGGTFDAAADNPYVLTVSATDSADILATWSNTGNNVDLSAPGVNVYTTTMGGGYGSGSGTSFSAPIVAGVAALMFSVNPSLTPTQAQNILKQSATDLGPPGWDTSYGWGRVDAAAAVQAAANQLPNPADTTAPTVSITAPVAGATVSGLLSVSISASDNVGVTSVELFVDGASMGTDTTTPYSIVWDTTLAANGTHTLLAKAYDAANNIGTSSTVSVTVSNTPPDTTPPTVSLTSPANGATVSGTVTVQVTASDNMGVTMVNFSVDGVLLGSDNTAPYSFSWNTTTLANGNHTLTATAADAAGNVGTSAAVSVTVANSLPDTTPPMVNLISPANGATITGSFWIKATATDTSLVTQVQLFLDNPTTPVKTCTYTPASPVTCQKKIINLSTGSHQIWATAKDASPNQNVGTSPTVTVTKP